MSEEEILIQCATHLEESKHLQEDFARLRDRVDTIDITLSDLRSSIDRLTGVLRFLSKLVIVVPPLVLTSVQLFEYFK